LQRFNLCIKIKQSLTPTLVIIITKFSDDIFSDIKQELLEMKSEIEEAKCE